MDRKEEKRLYYLKNKDKLKAILQYEEHANLAESRSMETETQQYFDQFRPSLEKLLPPSFYIVRQTDSFNVNTTNLEVYPGLLKNYNLQTIMFTNLQHSCYWFF